MAKTAKIFTTGRSQAVRLPKEFRFSGTEVEISRDAVTGGVILFEKPHKAGNWERFLKLRDEIDVPNDFMQDRGDDYSPPRDPFE
jgi:antitoxin VapB